MPTVHWRLLQKRESCHFKEDYEFGEGTSYLCMALANGVKGRYELSHENALKATQHCR
ncbi:MAG: hypothetical protein IPP96_15875 [Chitinophagaceae bacterium]|nr:hypothetical protein [Chitinophagaceae bacterium]